MHIYLYLDIFLWNEYYLLVIYSSTRIIKSVSKKAQAGGDVIKLYMLLNKLQEQEALETGSSELLSDADYMKAFQEIFSFPIIFS